MPKNKGCWIWNCDLRAYVCKRCGGLGLGSGIWRSYPSKYCPHCGKKIFKAPKQCAEDYD